MTEVESFTHKKKNQVIVSKQVLSSEDHILIIDDFLANGAALMGLINLIQRGTLKLNIFFMAIFQWIICSQV